MTGRAWSFVVGGVGAMLVVALILVGTARPGGGDPVTGDRAGAPTSAPITATRPEPGRSVVVSDPADGGGSGPLPSSEVGAGDASPGDTPDSQTDDARKQWQPVATGFGRAYTATRGKSPRRWRANLAPYVTATVADQLATVDLDNLPTGNFTGSEVAEYGQEKVAVFLHYDTGVTLVGYLILDDTHWRLYAYDHWQD